MRRVIGCSLLVVASTMGARGVDAQLIRGVALDSVSRDPVADAIVTLLDSSADSRAIIRTNARGQFTLKNPGSGYYALDVRAIGFKPHTSQWIALGTSDTLELRVSIVRVAPVLSRVHVQAQRDAIGERTFMGMKLKTMSARIITPQEVDAARGNASDYIELVQSAVPAGFMMKMLDVRINKRCIANMRNGKCVTIFVDGMRVLNADQALDLATPNLIDHVVVLRAIEAGVLLGGDADAGALLIFTKASAPDGER